MLQYFCFMLLSYKLLMPLLFVSLFATAQTAPFSLYLQPVKAEGLPGLQSYAYGQHDGRWLILGGRNDGLHQRQPFASFDEKGFNRQLLVIDPRAGRCWRASTGVLPLPVRSALQTTNMQFFQEGNYLYCIGGYGYSKQLDDHTTYSALTAIDVAQVIDAVMNGKAYPAYFRQITDSAFQVTGGRIKKIDGVYHLLGGQKFLGAYNPMGPDHGPGFIQEYSNSIKRFTIEDDGRTIRVTHLPSYTDSKNLHRRDYNAEAQVFPDRTQGVTMFSGVFQPGVDLPFLNAINVTASGYKAADHFLQFYNHYHCPVLPLYDSINNAMHTVFFGGIAQYYDSAGIMVQDNNVPFVKTIARVTRDASGVMKEYKLPVEMPGLTGAGAEFIAEETLPVYSNGVIKLNHLTGDSVVMGYIYGGIRSSAKNIFWDNTGVESNAASMIYRVVLKRNQSKPDVLNPQSNGALQMTVYPDPEQNVLRIQYTIATITDVHISINDAKGVVIENRSLPQQQKGAHSFRCSIRNLDKGTTLMVTLTTPDETVVQKINVVP